MKFEETFVLNSIFPFEIVTWHLFFFGIIIILVPANRREAISRP